MQKNHELAFEISYFFDKPMYVCLHEFFMQMQYKRYLQVKSILIYFCSTAMKTQSSLIRLHGNHTSIYLNQNSVVSEIIRSKNRPH